MQDAFRAPEIERAAALALQRDAHVFEHGQMREHRRDLERAHEAEPRHVGGPEGGDVVAVEEDAAAGRAEELGQQIEAGGLAGAVRADQRMDRAAHDAQIDAVTATKPANSLVRSSVSRMISLRTTSPHGGHCRRVPARRKGKLRRRDALAGSVNLACRAVPRATTKIRTRPGGRPGGSKRSAPASGEKRADGDLKIRHHTLVALPPLWRFTG